MTEDLRLNPGEVQAYVAVRLPHLKKTGREYRGPCLIHGGKRDNFSINADTGDYFCHSACGCGGDVYDLEQKLGGGDFGTAKEAVYQVVGRQFQNRQDNDIEATYDYTDVAGKLLYQVVRKRGKQFLQRRPDGLGGWIWNLGDIDPVPYRLPEIVKASTVFIVEGEKDVQSLFRVGMAATCNNGGAGSFKPALVPYFEGTHIVILPDNDAKGRSHSDKVATLLAPVAASIRIIMLPGLPEKGDVSDYLAAGGTAEDIRALVRSTDFWTPQSEKPDEQQPRQGIRCVEDIRPLSDYANQQIDWTVNSLLPAGAITLISGDSGAGKTTVVDAICDAVVNERTFAGMETSRRPVMMLDRENPLSFVVERRGRIGVQAHPDFRTWGGWCEDEPCDPGSPIITEWVARLDRKPVIVIDSFVAFARCDENSANEVRAFIQPLRKLADMGATVILLHHSGKGETSKEFRGSSDIKAAVDVAYLLANLGEPSRLSTLRLKAFKARFAVLPELILHYVEGVGFRMDSRGPSLTVSEVLRDLLIANPRIGATEFSDLAVQKGIARDKARDFIARGIQGGTIRFEKGAHNTRFHLWRGSGDHEKSELWENA